VQHETSHWTRKVQNYTVVKKLFYFICCYQHVLVNKDIKKTGPI